MLDGSALDGSAIRAAHRVEHGYPPFYKPYMLYGVELQDGQLVAVPRQFRIHRPVSFRGLSVA